MAQSNVYSLNIVGYVNKTAPPGFSMIANQLNTTNNTIAALLPSVPDGSQLFKYTTGSGYVTANFEVDPISNVGAWDRPTITLNPGEGAFFKNTATTNITLTFVGEVITGSSTNPLPVGFSIRSSIIPQAGTATSLLVPGSDGDQIFKYTPGSGYTTFNYEVDPISNVGAWNPDPNVTVGESFFIKKTAAQNWIRNFTVN